MSWTNFANQFKELVGQSPINYLTEWRMHLAYSALKQTKDTILSQSVCSNMQLCVFVEGKCEFACVTEKYGA